MTIQSGDKVSVIVTKRKGWHCVSCNSDPKVVVVDSRADRAIERAVEIFDLEECEDSVA